MKKILFISNISSKITNFSLPSIEAAQTLSYEFHLAANYLGFKDDPDKYGVKIHHIDIDRNPFSLKNIKAYNQMNNLLDTEKFDAIHCNTPIGGLLGRLSGNKARVARIIYTAHGFHFYKGASVINNIIIKSAEKWLAKYTDAIITINKEDYEAAGKFELRNKGKVYYVPGVGVDTLTIKKSNSKREEVLKEIGASSDSVLLISVGELNKNKNNEVIIKALEKLNNPKIHYILCGSGYKKAELCTMSKESGLDGNIHFFGYRTDIPELLNSCDIFVMPSYREGLSRSLMEAMSAGLPCIVSNIRGNVDLISNEDGGYLHSPVDFEGISKLLLKLSKDSRLRYKMGQANKNKIQEYDIKNIKKKMLEIYKNVLEDI